jgi:hypothetical protein
MATARPKSTADTAPQPQDAEHAFYRVIEAQAADLRTVRRCWPHREGPEVTEALTRLRARAAPDGAADAAMALVRAAYGGDVPLPVRTRLERYVVEHLHSGAVPPWPERDESEPTDEPAIFRKAGREQRRRREGTGA